MTYPKIKPCPKCGDPYLSVYKYDHGWKHVECDLNECGYMGPGSGSVLGAIRAHNSHAIAPPPTGAALNSKDEENG